MTANPKVTVEMAREHGLSDGDFARIRSILGRDPTYVELGIFSVMWSEHCSYKSSRVHLKKLPTSGPRVIQGPGENAGVVDISAGGDGLAVAFKMESHNHPSFIEPYQGAATGVGGIMRDVFTMGARPIACLDALRFGEPGHAAGPLARGQGALARRDRLQHLVEGVVAGIAGYGNAFGVPTVGGEVGFDACFDGNNLVNVMAVGVVHRDRIFLGRAEGVGNPVIYIGAKTGRDGIHGATMASAEFADDSAAKRPTVQVGDPFTEKLLLEACLELMSPAMHDVLVGIQDMGAAGLTSSSVEMASRAGSGLDLDLDQVPRREPGMTPYELMLSESQERMLLVARAGREQEVLAVCARWDIDAAIVGRVTDSGRVVVRAGGEVVADLPVGPLTDELRLDRPIARPPEQDERQRLDLASVPEPPEPDGLGAALLRVLGSPQVASKAWVWRQYDHMVRNGTVVRPGSDAAIVRLLDPSLPSGDTGRALALTTDCNSRFCFLDPYEGARLAVAEAYRNLCASGAEPIAVTDCLNFGNPERPEVMWQFAECVRGLADACRALATPVVSGNVSFYNETTTVENGREMVRSIHPTPMVGMVGLLPSVADSVTQGFKSANHEIALIGVNTDEVGGSEYLKIVHGRVAGMPPRIDLDRERAVGRAAVALAREHLIASAHDCAEGGLAVCLAECCLGGERPLGARVVLDGKLRPDLLLFGEAPSRIVVSYPKQKADRVAAVCREHGAPLAVLGAVGGHALRIERPAGAPLVEVPLADLAGAFHGGFAAALFQ